MTSNTRSTRRGTSARKIILTAAMMLGLLTAADAHAWQANSSETQTPTPTITRTEREGRQARLRGEGEWTFESRSGWDVVIASRFDTEGSDAELVVRLMADGDLIEDSTDLYYEGSFRVPREYGTCEGLLLDDGSVSVYAVVCADGDYVNMVLGTEEDAVLDVAEQMQDGDMPLAPRGYLAVD